MKTLVAGIVVLMAVPFVGCGKAGTHSTEAVVALARQGFEKQEPATLKSAMSEELSAFYFSRNPKDIELNAQMRETLRSCAVQGGWTSYNRYGKTSHETFKGVSGVIDGCWGYSPTLTVIESGSCVLKLLVVCTPFEGHEKEKCEVVAIRTQDLSSGKSEIEVPANLHQAYRSSWEPSQY